MKQAEVLASQLEANIRFDSKYHLSRVNPLMQELRAGKWEFQQLTELLPGSRIWSGNIFSRVYAQDLSGGRPLLVPYDLFRYLPWSDKILSASQTAQFDQLKIKRGSAYIVCSGRNLGPITIADLFCEQFCMSHDMVRIEPSQHSYAFFYAVAFFEHATWSNVDPD